MSSFTITNFGDVTDVAAGQNSGLEMRFARTAIESEHLGVTLMRYPAGARSPFAHSHREQEEAYVVVEGSGKALLDGVIHPLAQWDVLRVSPGVERAFEAGPDGFTLIAIGGDRPEGGDGVRVDAAWPAG